MMDFSNIDTDTKLHKVKLILKMLDADMDCYLSEHKSERGFISNLSPELEERVHSSLNNMISELENI